MTKNRNQTPILSSQDKSQMALCCQRLQTHLDDILCKTKGLYPVRDKYGNIQGYVPSLSVGNDDIEEILNDRVQRELDEQMEYDALPVDCGVCLSKPCMCDNDPNNVNDDDDDDFFE